MFLERVAGSDLSTSVGWSQEPILLADFFNSARISAELLSRAGTGRRTRGGVPLNGSGLANSGQFSPSASYRARTRRRAPESGPRLTSHVPKGRALRADREPSTRRPIRSATLGYDHGRAEWARIDPRTPAPTRPPSSVAMISCKGVLVVIAAGNLLMIGKYGASMAAWRSL